MTYLEEFEALLKLIRLEADLKRAEYGDTRLALVDLIDVLRVDPPPLPANSDLSGWLRDFAEWEANRKAAIDRFTRSRGSK